MKCGLSVVTAQNFIDDRSISGHMGVIWLVIVPATIDRAEIQDFLNNTIGKSLTLKNVIVLEQKHPGNENGYWVHYGCSFVAPIIMASSWSNGLGFLKPLDGYQKLCLANRNRLRGKELIVVAYGDKPFLYPQAFDGINVDILQ